MIQFTSNTWHITRIGPTVGGVYMAVSVHSKSQFNIYSQLAVWLNDYPARLYVVTTRLAFLCTFLRPQDHLHFNAITMGTCTSCTSAMDTESETVPTSCTTTVDTTVPETASTSCTTTVDTTVPETASTSCTTTVDTTVPETASTSCTTTVDTTVPETASTSCTTTMDTLGVSKSLQDENNCCQYICVFLKILALLIWKTDQSIKSIEHRVTRL